MRGSRKSNLLFLAHKKMDIFREDKKMKQKLIEMLKKLPSNKMPPSGIYCELVILTGIRRCWTCQEWLDYLE